MLGPIANDMKYRFFFPKTLRIRIKLKIILAQLFFFPGIGFNTFLYSLSQKWVCIIFSGPNYTIKLFYKISPSINTICKGWELNSFIFLKKISYN